MKKILFIINSLKCGGAERLLVDILKNIDYTQYSVSVLTFNKKVMIEDSLPEQIEFLHTIGFGSRISHWKRKFYSSFGMLDLYYKISICQAVKSDYDTIISFLEGFPLRAHRYIANKATKNVTFVHTDISTYPDSIAQFRNEADMKEAYSMMNEIIFVSDGALDGFIKKCGEISVKKDVLTNFIDIEVVRKKSEEFLPPRSDNQFEIVLLGRVTEVKGYDIIPQIAKLLKLQAIPAHFTIIGDGGYMPTLKSIIESLKVSDMVSLTGFKANPYPFLKQADIVMSTSLTEGLPLSLCEAMSLGKPIISSPTTGADYLLSDGTGIIVNRSAENYVSAIKRLYENPHLLESYWLKSLEKSRLFDKRAYIDKLYNLL